MPISENRKENRWVASLREFRKLQAVVFCGLMAALALVLNYVASINIGEFIRIGFSGLPGQVVSAFFGPAPGAIFGAVLDILKWALKPSGAYFPGFTLSAALGGIIYGFFLYRRPLTLTRVFLAHLCVKLFVNIGLNTFWLTVMYHQNAAVILPARILSNLVMLPIDTAICYLLLKAIEKPVRQRFLQ